MAHSPDPVFAIPGEKYVETPDGRPVCCMVLCCARGIARVPGLPAGSTPLDPSTKKCVLEGWQGSWRIKAPDPDILSKRSLAKLVLGAGATLVVVCTSMAVYEQIQGSQEPSYCT